MSALDTLKAFHDEIERWYRACFDAWRPFNRTGESRESINAQLMEAYFAIARRYCVEGDTGPKLMTGVAFLSPSNERPEFIPLEPGSPTSQLIDVVSDFGFSRDRYHLIWDDTCWRIKSRHSVHESGLKPAVIGV
jgi:hypothetical protein